MYKPFHQMFEYNWKFQFTNNINLFHYTNANALRSILESEELWATKSNFLNDYAETIYIVSVFGDVYKFIKERYNQDTVDFFDLIANDLNHFFLSNQNGSYYNSMFVISLSENHDSLTLWSQYSATDGYNIGLNLDSLIRSITSLRSENLLFDFCYISKIIYDYEEQRMILFNELIRIYDFYRSNDDGAPDRRQEALFLCRIALETYSIFFKKPAFHQEEEYRFAFTILSKEKIERNINYRIGNGSFVPYIKLPFGEENPAVNITIGPKNNIDTSKSGLIHYLEHRGYPHIIDKVYKSEITLRF